MADVVKLEGLIIGRISILLSKLRYYFGGRRSDVNTAKGRYAYLIYTLERAEQEAIKKWDRLSLLEMDNFKMDKATEIKEIKDVLKNARSGSRAEQLGFDKWDKLSILEVKKATNFDEAKSAYLRSRLKSEVMLVAWRKWIRLCKVPSEFMEAFRCRQASRRGDCEE